MVTFAIFTAMNHTAIDASKLFPSLSLLVLLTQPLFSLLGSMIEFASALGCFARIENFLLAETRVDQRLIARTPSSSGPSTSEGIGLKTREDVINDGIRLTDLKSTQLTEGTSMSDSEVINIKDGTFNWAKDGDAILRNINLSFQRSQLVLVVGPVASGKSTLLKTLLGETIVSKGVVQISTPSIAWCEQTPWLIVSQIP